MNRFLPRSKFYPEYDLDPQECVVCGRTNGEEGAIVTVDRLYLPWCQHCDHRRQGLDWGEKHKFPSLDLGCYKLGPGIECWHPVLLLQSTDDDKIYLLLAYIDDVEAEIGA